LPSLIVNSTFKCTMLLLMPESSAASQFDRAIALLDNADEDNANERSADSTPLGNGRMASKAVRYNARLR
jgi:hypothetical protein